MRFRLRTLLILLAVGPPVLAWGWRDSRQYRAARATVSARQAELAFARSQKLNRNAAERHAQLRLNREDTAARLKSILYSVLVPVTPN